MSKLITDPQDVQEIIDRYGFPRDLFAQYAFYQTGKKRIYIHSKVSDQTMSPYIGRRECIVSGLKFARKQKTYSKLTSAAAMRFGRFATKNRIEIKTDQLESFFNREVLYLDDEQMQEVTAHTYVVALHRQKCLGTAYIAYVDCNPVPCKALFPKNW